MPIGGYDADAIHEETVDAGIKPVIPAKDKRRQPAPRDHAKYRWRNMIERLENKLKKWRRVAARYDKAKESYLGFVALASIKLWIPFVDEAKCIKVLSHRLISIFHLSLSIY